MRFYRIFLPFHIQNRSVQLVTRNRERPKGINITFRAWFDRGSSCTLRTKSWITHRSLSFVQRVARYARNREFTHWGLSSVQQVARYARNRELHIKVNHSCNKLHATHEIVNYALRCIIRATSCTLRTKSWITHIEVNHSCNKLHATHKIVNYTSRFIIRTSRCTLRTKSWIAHWG